MHRCILKFVFFAQVKVKNAVDFLLFYDVNL